MRSVNPPDFDVAEVIKHLNVKDRDLRARVANASHDLTTAERSYASLAATGGLHKAVAKVAIAGLKHEELRQLYPRMRRNQQARRLYNRILLAVPNEECPLCGHGRAKSLDHFLPQSIYAHFSVTPANLVPACTDCNTAKKAFIAATSQAQLPHPYFDDLDRLNSDRWLAARLTANAQTGGPAVAFSAKPPATWAATEKSSVNNHFKIFELAKLYASCAGTEFTNMRERLSELEKQGPDLVEIHLRGEYRTHFSAHPNSWQTAMYEALAGSADFVKGGHKRIPQ